MKFRYGCCKILTQLLLYILHTLILYHLFCEVKTLSLLNASSIVLW